MMFQRVYTTVLKDIKFECHSKLYMYFISLSKCKNYCPNGRTSNGKNQPLNPSYWSNKPPCATNTSSTPPRTHPPNVGKIRQHHTNHPRNRSQTHTPRHEINTLNPMQRPSQPMLQSYDAQDPAPPIRANFADPTPAQENSHCHALSCNTSGMHIECGHKLKKQSRPTYRLAASN